MTGDLETRARLLQAGERLFADRGYFQKTGETPHQSGWFTCGGIFFDQARTARGHLEIAIDVIGL